MKKKVKKELHERFKQRCLAGLAGISVSQGYLISQEEAIKTKWFDESYLDDEIWTDSWDSIIAMMKSLHSETIELKSTAKVAPKVTAKAQTAKAEKEGANGKSI
tara:strand:+ start:311 stop:622 length:312 start_codon:yes stop_codon:yes gene_type:complete